MNYRAQPDGNSQPGEGEIGAVYLLHFEPPYKHAGRYLGWTAKSVEERVGEHVSGKGSPLVRAAVNAGCAVVLARVWENVDRHFERALKDQRNAQRLDPISMGRRTLMETINEGPEISGPAEDRRALQADRRERSKA